MNTSNTKPPPRTPQDSKRNLSWQWQIAQRLAKQGRGRTQNNPVAGYVLDQHMPSIDSRQGISATLALTALTDAIREQNELQRKRDFLHTQRYTQQRSLIEALVQFFLVFLLLIGVGGYAAFSWAVNTLGNSLDILSHIPGLDLPWLDGRTTGPGNTFIPNSVSFAPLTIATPYLLDDSPPGSWDFTLIDPKTDDTRVAIPSPCPGMVDEVGHNTRAGNYLWLTCQDGTRWFIAHLATAQVATNTPIKLGQPLGLQGSTGNSTGDHVHAVIDPVGGDRADRTLTRPMLEQAFAFWKQGNQKVSGSAMPQALALVKQLEGMKLEAYPDGTTADGRARWSIGYGTPSYPGETINKREAEQRLSAYLAAATHQVNNLVTVPLTANQQAALISFQYNTGGLAASRLLRHLNAGNTQAAAMEFGNWVHWIPHGQTTPEVAPGLVTRRKQEQHLFLGTPIAKAPSVL